MKRLLFLFLLIPTLVKSQSNPTPQYTFQNKVGIGRSGLNDTVAYLQIGPTSGGTKGLIIPRVANTSALIGSPKKALFFYDDSKDSLVYYNGTDYVTVGSGSGGGGGSGTVTNIATGTGITGGPITSTGTLKVDTALIATRARVQKAVDSLGIIIASAGLTIADTSFYVTTHLWHKKGIDSLAALVVKIADSATMLAPYLRRTDTASMLSPYLRKADTTAMLANYFDYRDTTQYVTTRAWHYKSMDSIMNNVNNSGKTYPDETNALYTIYDKSTWYDLTDFSVSGGVSMTLNSNKPRNVSATVAHTAFGRLLPNRPTLLNKWEYTVDFKIISAVASSTAAGPCIRSNNANGAINGYEAYILIAGSSTVTPTLAMQDGTNAQTGTTFTISVNDVIRIKMTYNDTTLVATYQNITTSSAVTTITKSFSATAAPYPPNTGTFGFQNFTGTYEFQRILITTTVKRNPNVLYAFDSKGVIFAGAWSTRTATLLNATYPTVLNYSGGGDQLKDFIDKREEVMLLNPEKVIIGLGSNDIRYGSSTATTMDRLATVAKMFQGSSTQWYVTVVPEDSTGGGVSGLTALKNQIAAAYPSNYIDLWTTMATSNIIKSAYKNADGIHPNAAGHAVMDSLIRAAGVLSVISANRRTPYNHTDGNILPIGDSIALAWKVDRRQWTIPVWDDSLHSKSSFIYNDHSKVIVSATNPFDAQSSTSLFIVNGAIEMRGNSSSFILYDRTQTSNFGGWFMNDNVTRYIFNGTSQQAIDSSGKFHIGVPSGVGSANMQGYFGFKKFTFTFIDHGAAGVIGDMDTSFAYIATGGYTQYNGWVFTKTTLTPVSSTASFTDASTLTINGAPIAGSSMTLTNKWALRIKADNVFLGDDIFANQIDSAASPANVLWQDPSTGQIKKGVLSSGSGTVTSVASGFGTTFTTITTTGTIKIDTSGVIPTNARLSKVIDSLVALTAPIVVAGGLNINVTSGVTWISDTSYTYTPDLNNTTNVASSTVGSSAYFRHGDVVTAEYSITIDPTAAAATVLEIELPPFTADGSEGTISGHITSADGEPGILTFAGATSGYCRASFTTTNTASHLFKVTLIYVTTD